MSYFNVWEIRRLLLLLLRFHRESADAVINGPRQDDRFRSVITTRFKLTTSRWRKQAETFSWLHPDLIWPDLTSLDSKRKWLTNGYRCISPFDDWSSRFFSLFHFTMSSSGTTTAICLGQQTKRTCKQTGQRGCMTSTTHKRRRRKTHGHHRLSHAVQNVTII